MNYLKIYEQLIDKHGSWNKPKEGYTERHRKVPGCLGGKYVKGNAYYMSADAHRLAHLLLVKLYPGNDELVYAANLMCNVTRRKYTWLKRLHAEVASRQLIEQRKDPDFLGKSDARRKEVMSQRMKTDNPMFDPDVRKKVSGDNHHMRRPGAADRVRGENNPMYGKCGEANPMYGKTHDEETRKLISERTSAAQKGKPLSEKNKQAIREGWARRIARLKAENGG